MVCRVRATVRPRWSSLAQSCILLLLRALLLQNATQMSPCKRLQGLPRLGYFFPFLHLSNPSQSTWSF